MKLLVITGSLFTTTTGPFWSVLSLVRALLEKGYSVNIFGSKDKRSDPDVPSNYLEHAQAGGRLKVRALGKYGPFHVHFTPTLPFAIRRGEKPDVILIQLLWSWNCLYAFWYAYRNKIRFILSIRGEFNDKKSLSQIKKRILMPLVLFILNRASFVHVLNINEKKVLLGMGVKSKIRIIPNGVYIPDDALYNAKSKNILFLGRLHPIKNLITLIKAWKKTPTGSWKLVIVGGDVANYGLEVEAAIAGDPSIWKKGPAYGDEKSKYFRDSAYFILPSLSEGMPMAALEAMAFGVPVILSKSCNLDVAADYGAGFITKTCEDGISQSLRHAIKITDGDRMKMSVKCIELVKNKFDWNKIAEKLMSI